MDNLNQDNLAKEVKEICTQIWNLSEKSKDSTLDLVLILREIESVHRQVREQLLDQSLPDTRHRLYIIIKHLEETGGWPYIPRMRLNQLCQYLTTKDSGLDSSPKTNTNLISENDSK